MALVCLLTKQNKKNTVISILNEFLYKDMVWFNVDTYNIINYAYDANSLGMLMLKHHMIVQPKAVHLFHVFAYSSDWKITLMQI